MRRLRSLTLTAIVLLVIFGGGPLVGFYTDALWFRSIGYLPVFLKSFAWEWLVGLGGAIIAAAFTHVNLRIAWGQARWTGPLNVVNLRGEAYEAEPERVGRFLWIGALVAGLLGGVAMAGSWLDVQRFLHAVPFGVADPLFGRDISFYFFRLPFYELLYTFLFSLILLVTIAVGVLYLVTGGAGLLQRQVSLKPGARQHLTLLFALLLGLKAWGYWLDAFELVYSTRGVAFGASYADAHAQLPALRLLLALALLAAAGLVLNLRLRRARLLWGLPVLVLVASVLGSLYPALMQQFVVKPDELTREKPYIQLNIENTRRAFGLDRVGEQEFPASSDLTAADLNASRSTIDNIRLWDWQPLQATYAQLQEIRPYYDFKDVDIDRYRVADPSRSAGPAGTQAPLRQVMLSAREMNNQRLPTQGLTWINQHLKYTHGYGLVMNPANEADAEGVPHFWLRDLPPRSDVGLKVDRPEIYYGETTDDYVVVKTREREFDYPAGDQNQETSYQGTGGVPVSSLLRRAAFALRLGSTNLLLSGAIKGDSRVLIYRNIRAAVRQVAPFLSYDQDPYVVLDNGRLVWILDAYTRSGAYPYSEPFMPAAAGQGGELAGANYVRNSVKVTIDAYDGSMHFYLADAKDPIALTYQGIFPGLFQPLAAMPASLQAHLRYPEDLFTAQAQAYGTYHMTSAEVFYNREDTWALPRQVRSQAGNNQGQGPMAPYYTIMQLPGEKDAEFVLMIPFTPGGRPNMISWLIARADAPNYGQLLDFRLPKQSTIYGPMQVEGRIDGDTTISQSLTLWSQSGSEVIRGNLLVVPVQNSVLYVEPLYLQATSNKLPELKRVIVAYADQVVMQPSLGEALAEIFGQTQPGQPSAGPTGPGAPAGPGGPTGPTGPGIPVNPALQALIQQANQLYAEAQEALKSGDWTTYGDRVKRLGEVLTQLQTGGATGTTGVPAAPKPTP
ncbi:MAG: UPF0182 family membrane protein [Symbiobacteriia bacterium]